MDSKIGTAADMGLGALAGAAATFVMDAITEIFYTEHIKASEAAVFPASASAAVASKILHALELEPSESDAAKAAAVLHWCIGVGSGMAAGLLVGAGRGAGRVPVGAASTLIAAGMLAFDEFGLSAIGATPPSSQYPWQTNFRSVAGHVTYGFIWAIAYAALTRVAG